MQIKKLVLTGAAAALVGGFAFAPIAQADEHEITVEPLVTVDGEMNEAGDGGHLVLKGGGDDSPLPNPLNNGYIGVEGDASNGPTVVGSCSGSLDDDGGYSAVEPGGDTSDCQPG